MNGYETHTAFCSACDRQVTVGIRAGYEVRPDGAIHPDAVVCFEHGQSCTGELCPLFGVAPERMGRNLREMNR